MKTFNSIYFAAVFFVFVSVSAHSQSISHCVPNISPRDNALEVTVTGVGMDFTSVSPLSVFLEPAAGGASIYSSGAVATSPTTLIATFFIPPGAVTGDYHGRVATAMTVSTPSVFHVTSIPAGSTGNISGHIFVDDNGNCIQDGVEVNKTSCPVEVSPGPYYILTDANGDYKLDIGPGSYSVRSFPPVHYEQVCPTGSLPATVAAPGSTDINNNFGLLFPHISDAMVFCNLPGFRPGATQTSTITVNNVGYWPLTGKVEFILDPILTYLSSGPTGVYSPDTVRWVISPPIPSGGTQIYTVTTNLPVGTPLGTLINCRAIVTIDSTDVKLFDNQHDCEETTIGSSDPNDKTVWDQDMNPADPFIDGTDSVLYYRIRFQNTGTAEALNIFIRDTLDPMLDPTTLETVGISHTPYTFNLSSAGSLEWRFPDINLPDSNANEPASHGFVMYRVKMRPGFTTGMAIQNQAYIYFDFNLPVLTNETSSSIGLNIEDIIIGDPVKVFPNPATDLLNIEMSCSLSDEIQFTLYNPLGTAVKTSIGMCDGNVTRAEISTNEISPGIYLLETKAGDNTYLKKVVILH